MKYLNRVLVLIAIAVFINYWCLTVLFSFPESSIVVAENYKAYKKFQRLFYQKWNFFAPPPTYNLRLYYVYRNDDKIYNIEIFENINQKVREKYLLNDTYANTSWFLFSNADNIIQSTGKIHNSFVDLEMYKDNKDISKVEGTIDLEEEYNNIRLIVQDIGSMQILLHNANLLAKEMKLTDDYDVQVIISALDIPRYSERHNPDFIPQERVVFATSFFSNINQKWIE